ncbi:hypothetical protein [Desulfocicer niacini]
MQLSEITEDTVLSVTAHARYPGAHCAFFGVAGMVPLIKNSCALMIGPAVCLYNAKLSIDLRSLTGLYQGAGRKSPVHTNRSSREMGISSVCHDPRHKRC